MIVQTFGALRRLAPTWNPQPSAVPWYAPAAWDTRIASGTLAGDYAAIYRTQPAVRVCVDFLGRNLAQIGFHVYQRTANDSRERVRVGLETVLARPNPWTSGYRLMRDLVSDLGVYGSAFWYKLPRERRGFALVRMHPLGVLVRGTTIVPTSYEWTVEGRTVADIPPDRVVHFRWYDPDTSLSGVSPLETLRRILLEERAAAEYRNALWKNGARIPGYIYRPKDAGAWNDEQRKRFREQFNTLYGGPINAGKIPVLEDGMQFREASFTASDAQYVESRKLNAEEVARVYQIPLPMVGILDHATFSNVKEQHKATYQDCFGPILAMIEGDLDLQILGDFHDPATHYVESQIAEKLKGSFEEQSRAIQQACGRPWLTVDEARRLANYPAMGGDAAELARPLNMTTAPSDADAPADDEPAAEPAAPPPPAPGPAARPRGRRPARDVEPGEAAAGELVAHAAAAALGGGRLAH